MNPDEAPMRPDEETDDLFGKLDQLISRHQGRAQQAAPAAPVPTLTETVEQHPQPRDPEIPVLRETVEQQSHGAPLAWPAGDRRRQLQVALYLRLRQRLDREFEALARRPPGDGTALAQVLQALRNALPAIIRESVDQALGDQLSVVSGQLSVKDDGADDH